MAKDWSDRALEIESFKVMDLLKRARELEAAGHDVVHMEVGEPDFPTAEPVAAAARAAIERGLTQYTPAAGVPELRQAIARFYRQRYGLEIAPERVIVTAGASAALLMVFALLADPGQQFMMADPGYPCNRQFLRLVEARGQLVPVDADTRFQLTPRLVAEHWRPETAGVLLASPANPTGSVLHLAELEALAQAVRGQGGRLVVDELYHGLSYGIEAASVLQADPKAFVINSFSKYFGMTGWRLGWIVAPDDAVPHLERLAQNLYISPTTVSQYAALAAFEPEALAIFETRRQAFAKRRDLLLNGLRELGFGVPVAPEGAFYIYADVSGLTDNAFEFCWDLLERDHLAVTPGLDFGRHRSNDFVRFSYTTAADRIELGLERLRRRLRGA
ncbi:aminotransferase [Marinobacterium nitratireducens]|uniref:Aminotransferase n=1 Tax=Marinobacterium nitratireducens TaxID=518897 RepID=A0A917ZQA0_9GAMM|nr:pyridoxal phosphate-dependent aminotransferase [Marinobacterium nitratireducens]GGO88563.1 aminotransferase [Marinobacterium nitratireducens]